MPHRDVLPGNNFFPTRFEFNLEWLAIPGSQESKRNYCDCSITEDDSFSVYPLYFFAPGYDPLNFESASWLILPTARGMVPGDEDFLPSIKKHRAAALTTLSLHNS